MLKTLLISIIVFPFLFSASCKKEEASEMIPNIHQVISINWKSSGPYKNDPIKPPTDSNYSEWFNKNYVDNEWSTSVLMPNKNWNCNKCDKYFKGHFLVKSGELSTLNFYIDFQSDDGIWIYVNDSFLGHYGGELHESGCVNMEEWKCGVGQRIDPKKINNYLIEGDNVVSIHVSDDLEGEYFNLNIVKQN